MNYRIGPGETPYWLFGFIFFGLLAYIVLDIIAIKEKLYFYWKAIILWMVVFGVIGSAFVSAIIVRHQTHPIYMIHDIILQQEAAIRFFLDGKNPYAVTYFRTPLEQWHFSDTDVNPALYHFVMEPFYLIFALPFYYISNHTIGYFDGRIPLLFLFIALLTAAWIIPKDQDNKRLFITLLAFNPAVLAYTLEGRSDMFMYAFLFFGLALLEKKKYLLSSIPIALSFAIKQSVWPFAPFYFAYVYFKTKNIKLTILTFILFVITFAIIVVPFFIWDPKAFWDSTVNYLSGNTSHSYPISGYGIAQILLSLKIISNNHQYYPFTYWQLGVGIPLFIVLLMYLRKNLTVNKLIVAYGVFLMVFWYFSRYFNNSHLGYLSVVFLSAYFFPEDHEDIHPSKEKRNNHS